MKLRHVAYGLAIAVASSAITAGVAPQDTKPSKPPAAPEMEQMMKEWQKWSRPGEHHRHLDVFVGRWNLDVKQWHEPGSAPMQSEADAEFKWLLDGRFVEGHIAGDMMGMPFEGRWTVGYNNFRKRYETAWVSNVDTALYTMTGKVSDGGSTFTFTGTMDDAMTGRKNIDYRSVLKVVDDSKIIEKMYGPDSEGNEFQVMEIVYTRAQ